MNSYPASGLGNYKFRILNENDVNGDSSWIEPQLAPKWLFSSNYWDLVNSKHLKDVLGWDDVLEVGVLPIGTAVYPQTIQEKNIVPMRGQPKIEITDIPQRTVGSVYRLYLKMRSNRPQSS